MGYADITKYYRVYAPKSQQILVASEPYVDESRKGSDLLLKHFLPAPLRQSAGEPKPRGWPHLISQKRTLELPNNDIPENDSIKRIQIDSEATESLMSASETGSKIHKLTSYDEAITDPVHQTR